MDPENRRIKVLLCDDDRVMRKLAREILKAEDDLEVIADAADGREALALVARLAPDVVLMDSEMPLMSGVDATQAIVEGWSRIKVILFSANASQETIDRAFAAGASGYLPKEKRELLAHAIRRVARGYFFLTG